MREIPPDQWRSQCLIHMDREKYTQNQGSPNHRSIGFFRNKRILLWTRKPGLGDMAMNAICCDILRRQFDLDVWYGCRFNPYDREFPKVLKGVPCYKYQPDLRRYPLPTQASVRGYEGGLDYMGQKHPFDFIIDFRYEIHRELNTLYQCLEEFGINQLPLPCAGLPVHKLPHVQQTWDVVISPDAGGWKPVRAYRRGAELEAALRKRNLSVLNISKSSGQGHFLKLPELLAHVQAAKLYIGVETGPTHLVSGVHRQALILQAGIHLSAFWNVYERTHVVEKLWSCGGRKCRVRKHEQCEQLDGVCMDRYAPDDIADLALQLIQTS